MKTLLIALGLVVSVSTAEAKIIAETNNNGGGKMVITDEKCRDNVNLLAYSVHPKTSTLFGCWLHDDNYIHIKWYDNDIRSYPIESWQLKVQPKATM
jgi:hypothetical protein